MYFDLYWSFCMIVYMFECLSVAKICNLGFLEIFQKPLGRPSKPLNNSCWHECISGF